MAQAGEIQEFTGEVDDPEPPGKWLPAEGPALPHRRTQGLAPPTPRLPIGIRGRGRGDTTERRQRNDAERRNERRRRDEERRDDDRAVERRRFDDGGQPPEEEQGRHNRQPVSDFHV